MDNEIWAVIVIIVIIIIVLYFSNSKSKLNGVWIADDSFCDRSEIEMMALVLTDGKAFILIINGDGNISHMTRYSYSSNTIKFKESFDEESFPKIQKFKCKDDRIILTSGSTIHFAGYRDSELSACISF
jgi:hypothetical protein